MECDTRISRSSGPIAMEDDQAANESSYSICTLLTPGEFALSDSEKAEALAENLETQFQPVTDPIFPAVIGMVYVALRSYLLSSASEPQLTNPDEVHADIRGVKFSNDAGLKCIPNSAVKNLAERAVSFLTHVFNAVLRTLHFPQAWKHARVISLLKP